VIAPAITPFFYSLLKLKFASGTRAPVLFPVAAS